MSHAGQDGDNGNGARHARGRRAARQDDARPEGARSQPPTLRDVAAIAGVDITLVSRVVNRDPRLRILPATRARIEAAIEETGYRPNVQARGLRTARTFTIGFLLPEVWTPTFGPIVAAATRRAAEQGYVVVLGSSPETARPDNPFEGLLLDRRVDGLLVGTGELNDAGIGAIGTGGARIVFVNRRVAGVVGSAVVDDAAGAALATSHLIGLGHRRLAHLAGPIGVDTASRRREGFLGAISEAGLSSGLVEIAGYDAEGGRIAAANVLARDPTVTGLVAANANVGIGGLRAIADAGLRVPGDVSVVAIHDHPLAPFVTPALTCVLLPLAELGAAAVDLVLGRVRGDAPSDVMVPGEIVLIERESTAPPSAGR